MKLTNNTVLITGGTSGIGYSLARHFSSLNNRVIICGRNQSLLDKAKLEIPDLIIYRCDVSDDEQLQGLFRFVETEYPELNILINNAGIQLNYDFKKENDPLQKISQELEINLVAPIKTCALFLPILMRNKKAAIVNITSPLGLVPKESTPVYCSSKAGLRIFTQSLRYQLEQSPVKVFELVPSLVDTEMTRGRGKGKITPDQLSREFLKKFAKNKYEIRIEKAKLLYFIYRMFPGLAKKILRGG